MNRLSLSDNSVQTYFRFGGSASRVIREATARSIAGRNKLFCLSVNCQETNFSKIISSESLSQLTEFSNNRDSRVVEIGVFVEPSALQIEGRTVEAWVLALLSKWTARVSSFGVDNGKKSISADAAVRG